MKSQNLLVSIYDKKTKTWSDVITVPNTPSAVRMMDQLVKSGTSIQSKYPGDFDLYQVGVVNVDDDGTISILQQIPVIQICSGTDFVEVKSNG